MSRLPSFAATGGSETNSWVSRPWLSKTSWRESEEPATVYSGRPSAGTSVVTYSNRLDVTVAVAGEMPRAKGEYTAWFTVDEPSYERLQTSINFTISSDADIGNGRGYCSPYDYASQSVLTIDGYKGTETLVNFPMYVRIKNNSPSGFSYANLKRGKDEIRFFDTTGKSLEYEVAVWNESGESAFWVRVPQVYKGAAITMCWNLRDGCVLPERKEAKEVWSDFVGVWHMDEDIAAATAAASLSHDATGHGLDAKPNCQSGQGNLSQMISTTGVFGKGRVNATESGKVMGNRLEAPSYDDFGVGDAFTVSFWIKATYPSAALYTQLITRKAKNTEGDGWQIESVKSDRLKLGIRGGGSASAEIKAYDSSPSSSAYTHICVAYSGTTVSVFNNGVLKGTSEGKVAAASDNGLPLIIGCGNLGQGLTDNQADSVNGSFDEVRLMRGAKGAGWASAEYAQGKTTGFYTAGAVSNDVSAVLKNDWVSVPTVEKTTWDASEALPTRASFGLGMPYGAASRGTQTLVFYNRATGELLGGEVPKAPGDYRAVVSVAEIDIWGALEYTLDFRIVSRKSTHELGLNYDRILLMNDDYSVAGGEVAYQSYDCEDDSVDLPHWKHLDENGDDASTSGGVYWSDSLLFNLGGGSHHLYFDGDKSRLWDLRDVRIGNTFNNGEILEDEEGFWEMDDEGLAANQNYLSWNPSSQRVLNLLYDEVGPYHRFAGQIVMQNTLDSAVTSSCYTNGIGTIYFDAVNGWTDNITNASGKANYRLVVEIATNRLNSAEAPTDERTDSVSGGRLVKAAAYADWHEVPIRVLRFDGTYCEDLGMRESLTLGIEDGGNYECFYRVIVPVKVYAPARFRIRRIAIDETYKYNPDGLAYILVDNVICSSPTLCANLEPYGRFDATKSGKRELGVEGAFVPAFPSTKDTAVRGRAKVRMSDGSAYAGTGVTAATMHYRWHYLEQKTTDWMLADLDLKTFVSKWTLDLPQFQGDIDFWFELNQNMACYAYADYSGLLGADSKPLGLGNSGYTEEILSVTNRAAGADWFVRTREGTSSYAEARVLVKTSEKGPVQEIDMTVSDNRVWRGFFRMKNEIKDGILWRVELRDRQEDGETTWNANTNCLYVKDWVTKLPEFPAAGRLSEGTADEWSRMPCDKLTDYLMFQVEEQTYGVTVIHSAYQDFNSWNDAGNGYFTGSSAEPDGQRGTAADVRTYDEKYAGWPDEAATNDTWSAIFEGPIGTGDFYPSYKTFSGKAYKQWDLGKGMWVHEYYRDDAGRVGFQMAGGGDGYMEFKDKTQLGNDAWPRGIESVSFNARIAQKVSFNEITYLRNVDWLTNYTFMTRACFDMNKNRNFAGNASLSLFAYYQDKVGAYEARWEQIAGEPETNAYYKGVMVAPAKRGQRLVISRWNRSGGGYANTVLNTVYNDGTINADMPLMPYNSSATNNLMPFCISVFKRASDNATVIVAGVYIGNDKESSSKSGIAWNDALPGGTARWYFACAVDNSSKALKSGSYGVMSSNCEGLFLTPQFREGATYPSDVAEAKLAQGYYTKKKPNSVDGYIGCYADIKDGWWAVDPGREQSIRGASATSAPYGFAYAALGQSVDVYTKPMTSSGPSGEWTLLDSIWLEGFGKPGTDPGYTQTYCYPSDVALRLQTGGDPDDEYPVDVVIADVSMRQWRGRDNWSTADREWDWNADKPKTGSRNDFGYTNVVYTTGWMSDGAVRLSAKRTVDGTACSVRSPLLDGYDGRGEGLGKLSIRYRRPTTNIRLLVQVATNYAYNSGRALKDMSRVVENGSGNGTWHTVTNLTYRELWSDNESKGDSLGQTKVWSMSLGYHGAKGMMRVVVDNDLVRQIEAETNPKLFGEIDIVEAMFKDEPSLDKGCWWGWNLQTIGDPGDTQRRMYLPDCTGDLAESGQSLALNNSVTADTDPAEETENFKKHMPFLQSPTFTNGVIGQLSFKARKYDLSDRAPDAKVVVYGAGEDVPAEDLSHDDGWTFVAEFPVTNTIYTTYTYKTDGQKFRAVRLAVVDVDGTEYPPSEPEKGAPARRVLLDEVMVSEAVRAMLAFRNVGAFRSKLDDLEYVPGAATAAEQPLCDENWGIQAEVFASMLEGEIDPSSEPKVRLHWYVGKEPWGFEKWKSIPDGTHDKKGAQIRGSAYLAQTEGSNYVYRSSYKAGMETVMPAQEEPDTVVQYMLEVEYMVINAATGKSAPATNWLDAASWSTPSWYAPIDFNADPAYGANKTFAGYSILDKIAPGWAWINEANVYGTRTKLGGNSDEQYQYVEVCVPFEADLTGWRLRFLEYLNKTQVTTNWIARFGNSLSDTAPGMKDAKKSAAQNKTFRLIGNKESAKLRKDNETLDGVWSFSAMSSLFGYRDEAYYIRYADTPVGVQLLRPSGIIESSVVIIGTNELGRLPGWETYDPSYVAKELNRLVPGSKFFYAAEDCMGENRSGSVTSGRGESPGVWTNGWICTPGYINRDDKGNEQDIDPDHPTPHGDSILVYTSVDTTFGRIRYKIGDGEVTTDPQMVRLVRGGKKGTNITYYVDSWYELASVTTNGAPFWKYERCQREKELWVGIGASNNLSVVGTAQVDSDLADKYGLTKDNPYTPAVMDWLVGGTTLRGEFANNGKIALADYLDMRGQVVTNLTLTQMYWLDMDPTVSNLVLQGGFAKAPWEERRGDFKNRKMSIFLMISNRTDGAAWSPYVLRGLDPNYTSLQYEEPSPDAQSWTSETFKVTGILANGKTSRHNIENWIPLRLFVFHEDSFYQPSDEPDHARFTSDIEIADPHYNSATGWDRWFEENDPEHKTMIYHWWYIDDRMKSTGVEVLKKENFY